MNGQNSLVLTGRKFRIPGTENVGFAAGLKQEP